MSSEFLKNCKGFWGTLLSPHAKRDLFLFLFAISVVLAGSAYVQVYLNLWQGNIYDAIGKKNFIIFMTEVKTFLEIVSILLCLGVVQTWLYERLKVRLRKTITYNIIDAWFKPNCILLSKKSGFSRNPDQRVQDDVRALSEITVDLVVGLIQSSFILIAFIGVLWELSEHVKFFVYNTTFVIHGYMVWVSLGYAFIGSLLTWLVGKPLIRAYDTLSTSEAKFRFSIMSVNKRAEEITRAKHESIERNITANDFETIISTLKNIANRLAMLNCVAGSYGWLALLVPLILAAPGYFDGGLSLGGLMMVVGGFAQVQGALRWFIDRFPAIAKWQAMLGRVISYRMQLEKILEEEEKELEPAA
jgi:putative ATP-binding cassette transporter